VIRRSVRSIAVWLALVGQLVGAFGLPALTGSAGAPDAACGCCPADRSAGRCCCSHKTVPAPVEPAPCCRGKKSEHAHVVWVIPTWRSHCTHPDDTAPSSGVPVSLPPDLPTSWSLTPTATDTVSNPSFHLFSRGIPPDDPPPRAN
jgi:hypothetical protein